MNQPEIPKTEITDKPAEDQKPVENEIAKADSIARKS